jgi:hypothetical protein
LGLGSYQVVSSSIMLFRISSHFGFRVVLDRVSDHLVLGHFGFRVVSVRIGLDIGSFNIRLFRTMDRIGSERVRRVSQIGSGSATSKLILPVRHSSRLVIYCSNCYKDDYAFPSICYNNTLLR